MSDPLYRKELLRLAADAMGAGRLAAPDASATLHNPACGDRITLDLGVADGRITALGHRTEACVLTQASAAILGAAAVGMGRDQLEALAAQLRVLLTGGPAPAAPFQAYAAFDGVAAYAGRHVCVLLPVEAALEALSVSAAEPGR
jgi:nitrogen fixation protein NifU and related proteins